MMSLLQDRRDSSGSATSSAYLSSSRRSSGISPCFSSRRSSQASQSEHSQQRQLHNLSATDSYDPISTDASRRSSETSQCGGGGGSGVVVLGGSWSGESGGVGGGGMGSKGVLNLTPAQHYHLKATYAVATGGPPPTPLPNMEQVSYKIQMTMARDMKATNELILPSLVSPRHSSDGSSHGKSSHIRYRCRGLYPGEGPDNSDRRASDPLRPRDQNIFGSPQIQRFGSQNNMDHLPPLVDNNAPGGFGKSANHQNYINLEGNIYSGQLSPFPPSIMEQSAIEALAMEHDGTLLFRDDDVLPEDNEAPCSQQNGINYQFHRNYFAQNIEGVQNIQNPSQQHGAQEKHSLPIQWNEVSSGSTDISPPRELQRCEQWPNQINAVGLPFVSFENMIVQQQLPSYFTDQQHPNQRGSVQQITELTNGHNYSNQHRQGSNSSQQLSCRMSQGVSVETTQQNSNGTRRNSSSAYNFGQQNFQNALGPIRPSSVLQASQSQTQQLQQNHEIPCQISENSLQQGKEKSSLSHVFVLSLQSQCAMTSHPVDQDPSQPQQYSTRQIISSHNAQSYQSFTKGNINNCSFANQVSGKKLEIENQLQPNSFMQQQQIFEQCFDPAKSSVFKDQQCQMESFKIETGESCGSLEDLLTLGADQVTSTVESNPDGSVQDDVGLHFTSNLNNSLDQGSLVSDVISHSVVHDLSQTSSWLTTPHLSAVLHSLPPGTTNMAIGDMSSLLTTLPEESKFLAIMQ